MKYPVDEEPLASWSLGEDTPRRYYVDDVAVSVATERVQYLGADGKLITESLKDYSRKTVLKNFASLDDFLTVWNNAERKQVILEALAVQGVFLDELAEQVGRDYDAFALVCHVAYDRPPRTRKERAEEVKKRDVFAKHGEKARAVLDALLQKYADAGISSVDSLDILKVDPFRGIGTPHEIISIFGGEFECLTALREIENELYRSAA